MNSKHPFERAGFFVQFFFGALIGALIGFAALAKGPHAVSPSSTPAFCYIGIGALVCGVIAGFAGDAFWQNLGKW